MKHVIGCTSRPYASLAFPEACRRIAAAGYTDVGVFRNLEECCVTSESTAAQVAAVRAAAQDVGLTPSMLLGWTHLDLGLEAAVDDYRRLIDKAAALGARWLLDPGTGDQAHYADYYELMRRAAPYAAQRGIGITLKPHGGITLTAEDLIRASEQVNHPAFGLCYDPGNIVYYTNGEHRPEPDAKRIASVVSTAIIKDCAIRDGEPDVMITPGEGLVDFEAVLGGLCAGGFTGPVYVECVGGETCNRSWPASSDEPLRQRLCRKEHGVFTSGE